MIKWINNIQDNIIEENNKDENDINKTTYSNLKEEGNDGIKIDDN